MSMFERWKKKLRRYVARIFEQRWINVGLRAKMGVIVEVGLVGLMVIFALLGISTARQVTRQVLNERVMLAHLGADTLDSTFHHIQSMLAVVAAQEALQNTHTDPNIQQKALQTGFDLIAIPHQGGYLFDEEGRLRTAVTETEIEIDWSRVQAIAKTVRTQQPSLSVVNNGHPWLAMAVPVLDKEGQAVGAVATLLDLTNPDISPFEPPFDLGQTGMMDVVDAQGRVLMSTQPDRVLTISEQANLLRKLFVTDEPTVETCVGCANESTSESDDRVMAFAPMSEAPWGVVIHQDAQEVFAAVARLKLLTFLLGTAAVVGALSLVWITTSSVIAPLQLLTDAAKRITDGDLTTPVCCRRGDEIGELAASFDAMRARLRKSMEEVQAWTWELDARVQERTRAARTAQLEAQRVRDDLRAIIDGLSDELIVVTTDRRILQINRVAEARYAGRQETLGQACYDLIRNGHPCEMPDCQCPVPLVLKTGKSVKVTHIHRDANHNPERYLDIVASPMYDAEGYISRVIELRRDVTDEKQIEASLVRRNQELAILNAITTTVNQSLELEDILDQTMEEMLRLTNVDVGAIFLKETVAGHLELMTQRGLSEESARLAARLGMLDGSCGGVMEAGQVIVIPDLSRYRGKRAESLRQEKLCSLVHVPLITKGRILGSMCVGTRCQREFDTEEQELLTAIGNQIAVAIENVRLYAELQHKEHLRGQLLKKVITAQEEERKRIARELHDDTSQSLTALLYAVEGSMETNDLAEIMAHLENMRQLAVHTLDGVHKLIFDLRPTMLDHLGLVPALRWFSQSRLEPRGIRLNIQEDAAGGRLPAEVETVLFRVVQEAITNIARHAAARNVDIVFRFKEEAATIEVEDDGIGFDIVQMTPSPDSSRGLGLMGMHERIELVGGQIEINTAPGEGTHIYIQVPLAQEQLSTPYKEEIAVHA